MKKLVCLAFLLCVLPVCAQKKAPVFKRFSGTVTVVDHDVIKFDDELLIIYKSDNNIKKVFESGLLYPGMFKFPGIKYKQKDALNAVFHNFTVTSAHWINSKSGQVRLLKLVLLQNGAKQSVEYFVELFNPKGTSKGDFLNFVQEAQLKSFRRGKTLD